MAEWADPTPLLEMSAEELAAVSDEDLACEFREYIESYEPPNEFFSGHNAMAVIAREVMRRWESQ